MTVFKEIRTVKVENIVVHEQFPIFRKFISNRNEVFLKIASNSRLAKIEFLGHERIFMDLRQEELVSAAITKNILCCEGGWEKSTDDEFHNNFIKYADELAKI